MRMSIVINMSEDANQERTGDRNQTFVDFDVDWSDGLKNVTEIYSSSNYTNFTSLPDVNTTEEIDSFYFYEVSKLFCSFLRIANCEKRYGYTCRTCDISFLLSFLNL